jgi:hypothetical protein
MGTKRDGARRMHIPCACRWPQFLLRTGPDAADEVRDVPHRCQQTPSSPPPPSWPAPGGPAGELIPTGCDFLRVLTASSSS